MLTRDILRPAQLRIIEELKQSTGVQAVLGMGGGKTISSLTAIRDLLDEGTIRSAIIVAPVRVAISTWPNEIRSWEHIKDTDFTVLIGSPEKRLTKLREDHEIYICSIDNLVWLVDALRKFKNDDRRWDLLCIDELSRMKSPRGQRAKKLLRFAERFDAIWGLTGTPRPNSWEDQWMPLQVISAGDAWGLSFDNWRRENFRQLDYNEYRWGVMDSSIPKFQRVVDTWSFTIPPEEATDVPFNSGPEFDRVTPLTLAQMSDLNDLQEHLLVELGREGTSLTDLAGDEELIAALSMAVASGKMDQILQGFLYRDGETIQTYDNAKLGALTELLDDIDGENSLIAYHYQEDLRAIRHALGDIPHLGSGQSEADASRIIEAWNAGDIPQLALHPASAGHGLNLQFGGRRMIWYRMTWSPELYAQACKRLARPGQPLPVYVHRILADHPLERMRLERVETRVREDKDFIQQMRRV